jgi:hypothetical protein
MMSADAVGTDVNSAIPKTKTSKPNQLLDLGIYISPKINICPADFSLACVIHKNALGISGAPSRKAISLRLLVGLTSVSVRK